MIKQIEVDLFENLRRHNPTFESSVLKWEPGQDPPDFVSQIKSSNISISWALRSSRKSSISCGRSNEKSALNDDNLTGPCDLVGLILLAGIENGQAVSI